MGAEARHTAQRYSDPGKSLRRLAEVHAAALQAGDQRRPATSS
jgi:hypothetical protein